MPSARPSRRAAEPVSLAKQAPDRGHHLFGALVLLVGFGTDYTRVGVPVEEPERDLVQRGLSGAYLGEDVDAVAVVLGLEAGGVVGGQGAQDPRQPMPAAPG